MYNVPSKLSKTIVSTTEIGGGNTANSQAAWKKQSNPNNKKSIKFTDDAKAESIFYQKVITGEANQVGQVITVVSNLSSYIGDKGFPGWAENIRLMQRKTQDNFMPAAVGKSVYGTLTAGVFVFNGNAFDTEDQ